MASITTGSYVCPSAVSARTKFWLLILYVVTLQNYMPLGAKRDTVSLVSAKINETQTNRLVSLMPAVN